MRKAFLIAVALAAVACAKSSAPLQGQQKPEARTVVSRKVISGGGDSRAAHRVFKDPVTGKVREPTADEAKALELATPPQAPSRPITQTTYSDGSTSVDLNEDYMSDVVVERAPDGTLTTHCNSKNDKPASAAPTLETK